MWILGLDLGQSADPTAAALVERQDAGAEARYAVRGLERWLGVSYPVQVRRVGTMLEAPELAGARLVLDRTGVGRPVFDLFQAAGFKPVGVTLHGGDTVAHDGNQWSVPKRDVVFAAVAVLQQRRLDIARALPEAATLVRELETFRMRVDPVTAHDSYAAWRDKDHDDVLLAVALGIWWGERHAPVPYVAPAGGHRRSAWSFGPAVDYAPPGMPPFGQR